MLGKKREKGKAYWYLKYPYPMYGIKPVSLAKEVRDRTGVSEATASLVIKTFFEVLRQKLLDKECINMPKIGWLFTWRSKTHKKLLPETNSHVFTPPRTHVRFRPCEEMRKEIQRDDKPAYRRYYGSSEEGD